eukprot:2547409-Rhodomonas_salina.2
MYRDSKNCNGSSSNDCKLIFGINALPLLLLCSLFRLDLGAQQRRVSTAHRTHAHAPHSACTAQQQHALAGAPHTRGCIGDLSSTCIGP